MKAPFSNYLESVASGLKKLIGLLGKDYDYVSALATDSKGLMVRVSQIQSQSNMLRSLRMQHIKSMVVQQLSGILRKLNSMLRTMIIRLPVTMKQPL